jgi:hypothetical protein
MKQVLGDTCIELTDSLKNLSLSQQAKGEYTTRRAPAATRSMLTAW